MGFHKDISGQRYGRYEIIGDTGKRDKNRGVIVIARNIETGELHEGLASNFKKGRHTGYMGSTQHSEVALKNYINNKEKMRASKFRNGFHSNNLEAVNFSDNITGYRNIFFNNNTYRWYVGIVFKKQKYTKTFVDFEDAVIFVNDFKIKNINPLIVNEKEKFRKIERENIVKNDYVIEKQELIYKMIAFHKHKKAVEKSLYHLKNAKGYSWKKDKQKWKAYITLNGKQKHLGYFDNEQDAIKARKEAVDEQIKKLEKEMEQL